MDPKTAESAQALFCALADYVQLKRGNLDKLFNVDAIPTYKAFKVNWDGTYDNYKISTVFKKNIETDVTTLGILEKALIDNPDWYKSSVLIAKKLIEDIDSVVKNFKGIKKPKPTEIWFSRGDQAVMKNIELLFKIANKTRKEMNMIEGKKKGIEFGQLNKWNPADIYFATDIARNKIEKELKNVSKKNGQCYLFSELNCLISDLIEDGQLLPLSLKKQTREVTLHKVNFDRQYELNQFANFSFAGFVTNFQKSTKGNLKTRSITVKFNPKESKYQFQVQHDVSNNDFKVSISGVEARGGGISSINVFASLVHPVDASQALIFKTTWRDAQKDFANWKIKWQKTYGPAPEGEQERKKGSPLRKQFEKDRDEASAILVSNKFMPEISKWLKTSQVKSDKFVKIIYEYATSRTEDSGKFIIAK